MSGSVNSAGVVPASLSFLAIYNPSLSTSDETLHDQIVYYYSRAGSGRKSRKNNGDAEVEASREERNERLRQIGLAQGMVEFAKSFSDGEPVDSIETDKSRIILYEIEKNWWILASVNLTRLPCPSRTTPQGNSQPLQVSIEYSAREVSPPALILKQILRAHQIFLLHQAPSIADLYTRVPRPKFCGFLKRFWDSFIWDWNVLLHGNPAVDIFNGLKLAAGGELGIGVGEEDWGSGEREVLEGFIEKSEGLVDLIVSRFGDTPRGRQNSSRSSSPTRTPSSQDVNMNWQISGEYPRPSDGIIFSGIGALTRASVRDISSWIEWLYMHGEDAYGVRDNPSSNPRRKRAQVQSLRPRKVRPGIDAEQQQKSLGSRSSQTTNGRPQIPIGIPPPIVASDRPRPNQNGGYTSNEDQGSKREEQRATNAVTEDPVSGTETFMKYLTLGVYGSTWGIPSGRPPTYHRVSSLRGEDDSMKTQRLDSNKANTNEEPDASRGYFLIGLQGELEEDVQVDVEEQNTEPGTDNESAIGEDGSLHNRIMMRSLHVERRKQNPERSKKGSAKDGNLPASEVYFDRLRVVVYVQKPFIFTFLFEVQTDALAISSFYRSLHHQLGPLQRPLLASTSPSKISERLWEAAAPKSTASTKSSQPICDVVYDPSRLTVHTTIPNIPEPGPIPADTNSSLAPPWTRVEGLSVHSQILNTFTSTRSHASELERTCKTSRGWWVVWMRLPHGPITQHTNSNIYREAFLIRKASDYVAPKQSRVKFGQEVSDPSASGWGPGKLAEGIGIDARQYIEGLLSLNR